MDQAVVAQVVELAVHDAFSTASGQRFKCIHIAQHDPIALCCFGQRL